MPRTRQNDAGPIIPGRKRKRPAPPPELTARERKIWTEITARLPADWFVASWPLLVELCRHSRLADELMDDIARARVALDALQKTQEPRSKLLRDAAREYRSLLRMHGLQSQRIGALSTTLRLTPQSRYARSTAHVKATETDAEVPLWQDWGIDRPQ
jgi:hypothetical protein